MTLRLTAALFALLLSTLPCRADPLVLRFGYPGIGVDNRQSAGGDIVAVVGRTRLGAPTSRITRWPRGSSILSR